MSDASRASGSSVGDTRPLRERLPDYAVSFTVGLGVMVAIGFLWGLGTRASLLEGISWTLMLGGVLFLLVGGASGGGYTNIGVGAFGSIFGGRQNYDEDVTDEDIRRGKVKKRDARDRLRRGLRPPPNPTAFWQVIGGLAYVGIGLLLLEGLGV